MIDIKLIESIKSIKVEYEDRIVWIKVIELVNKLIF